MKIKKILAGAVAAVMAAACLPTAAFAEAGEEGGYGDWEYYVLEDGTLALTSYNGDEVNVTVPSELNGIAVTQLWGTFAGQRRTVETVHIPESVVAVGRRGIQSHPFYEAKKLVSITVDESNKYFTSKDGVLFSKDMTVLYAYPIGKADTEYTVPDGVKTIEEGAFYLSNLTSVTISDSVTNIVSKAFANSMSLKKIIIPASVEKIGYSLEEGVLVFSGYLNDLTIYGYTGSYAETFAKANGITFADLSGGSSPAESTPPAAEPAVSVEDKDTGVTVAAAKGVLEEGTELVVKPKTVAAGATEAAFEISLEKDGKAVQPNGTVTVTIPVPEALAGAKKYYVYYKADDGKLTDMKATFANGKVTFSTDHFSTYIVSTVDLLADKDSPSTGIEGVAVIAGLAIIASAALVISKKRK